MPVSMFSAWIDVLDSTPDPSEMWADPAHLDTAGWEALSSACVAVMDDPGDGAVVMLADSWGVQGGSVLEAALTSEFGAVDFIDSSVSGNRSDQMWARWDADVAAHDPVTIILFTGFANDVYQDASTATLRTTIKAMVASADTLGAQLIVPGVCPFSLHMVASQIRYHVVRSAIQRPEK